MKLTLIGRGFISSWIGEVASRHNLTVEALPHTTDPKTVVTDILIYAASYGNYFDQTNEQEILKANVGLLRHFMRHATYNFFVHISSSSVTLPVLTPYAKAKALAEQYVQAMSLLHPTRYYASFRPYSVYGPRDNPKHFIPTVLDCVVNNKKLTIAHGVHDWLYVEDFAQSIMLALRNGIDGIIEVGTGVTTTNHDVLAEFEFLNHSLADFTEVGSLRPYDTDSWKADLTQPGLAALIHYGFKPRSFEKGAKETYEAYCASQAFA